MIKKQFSIQAYTILATAILGSDRLKSQIVMQDFDPDLRLMNWQGFADEDEPMEIDIDGNGIYDLKFDYDFDYSGADIELYINDCVIGIGVEESDSWSAYNINFFNTNQLIGESLIWTNDGFEIISVSSFNDSSSGCNLIFSGNNFVNKYLPIKLQIGANIHYGWVRLSINTIGHHLYNNCYNNVGSPLTIFSTAYNSIPDASVFCNEEILPENGSTENASLIDNLDDENIGDIAFAFYADEPDYSEIRIFILPTREETLNFSLNDAISLDASRYYSIPADLVVPGVFNIFNLPVSLPDINGNAFVQDSYYSAYFMKMPKVGESAVLTLSTPMNIIKPELQACHLNIENIDMHYLSDEGYFQIYFTQDEDESDISSYGVGVVNENYMDWLTYYGHTEYIDLTGIIQFPKTGETEYNIDLIGLSKDIYGDDLITGGIYTPFVFGFGDGHFADLLCYDYDRYLDVPLPVSSSLNNTIQIQYYNNTLLLELPVELAMEDVVFELVSVMGQKIIVQKLVDGITSFELSRYSKGLYFASIYHKGKRIAIKEIGKY